MGLRRLDSELVRRNLATSRQDAKELIGKGLVKVNGAVAIKPTSQVDMSAPILVEAPPGPKYVSRGAHKLLGALDALGDDAPLIEGQVCLDAGASTGGFTQVLLEKGAAQVIAVDVGYGQLAWDLRTDPRVVNMERTNIRYLEADQFEVPPHLIVADLSFISLELVLPSLQKVAPSADLLVMVKPQFEVGKGNLGRNGVVWEGEARAKAVLGVAQAARVLGFSVWAVEPSPLPGPAGNVEYFLALSGPEKGRKTLPDLVQACRSAVERGPHPQPGKEEDDV